MIAALKAHRWTWCAPLCLLTGVGTVLFRDRSVELPLLLASVPVPSLLGLVAVVAAVTPLHDTVPTLSATLVREPAVRRARVVASVGLAWVGHLPGLWTSPTEDARYDVVTWALLLVLGLLGVALVGDYAWLVVLAAGFTLLTLERSTALPVGRALAAVPLVLAGVGIVLAAALVAVRGPRRPGA